MQDDVTAQRNTSATVETNAPRILTTTATRQPPQPQLSPHLTMHRHTAYIPHSLPHRPFSPWSVTLPRPPFPPTTPNLWPPPSGHQTAHTRRPVLRHQPLPRILKNRVLEHPARQHTRDPQRNTRQVPAHLHVVQGVRHVIGRSPRTRQTRPARPTHNLLEHILHPATDTCTSPTHQARFRSLSSAFFFSSEENR